MFKLHVVSDGGKYTKEYPATNTKAELQAQMDKAFEDGSDPADFVVYVRSHLFTYTPPVSRLVMG